MNIDQNERNTANVSPKMTQHSQHDQRSDPNKVLANRHKHVALQNKCQSHENKRCGWKNTKH